MLSESPVAMREEMGGVGEVDELEALLRAGGGGDEAGERERGPSIFRSGSAPPTIEGSLNAISGLLRGGGEATRTTPAVPDAEELNGHGGLLSEEELRADPAYLSYYYSHGNLNPRLPPPVLTKEDWRSTQRLKAGVVGGIGDRRKVVQQEAGQGMSLFPQNPGFDREDDARKGVGGAGEWVDRGGDGLIGLSLGRQRSFADMLQDNLGRRTPTSEHPSRATSRNSFLDNQEALNYSENQYSIHNDTLDARHSAGNAQSVRGLSNINASASQTFASVLGSSASRNATPDPHYVPRVPSPGLPPVGVRVGSNEKRLNSSSSSFNTISSKAFESDDILTALSDMNLSKSGTSNDNNNISQSTYQRGISDHHNLSLAPQAAQVNNRQHSVMLEAGDEYLGVPSMSQPSNSSFDDTTNLANLRNPTDMRFDGHGEMQRSSTLSAHPYQKSPPSCNASPGGSPAQHQNFDGINPAFLNYGLGGYPLNPGFNSAMMNYTGSGSMSPLFESAAAASAIGSVGSDSRNFGNNILSPRSSVRAMGVRLGRVAWACPAVVVVVLVQLAGASHVVYETSLLETEAAAATVPASILELGTGYHFRPPKNWINDPNAPLYYKGWYHLFYQYNPKGAVWGNIVWAHSVSRDLINWVALETAISPSIESDKYGCWSGSATILPDGTPAIMYTGISRPDINYEVQNIAYPKNTSDPLLREWVKPGHNPVIVPEGGINATQFRDPTTAWYADGHWRILVGALSGASRGVAYVYRSRDFRRWTRVRKPLHSAPTGMWECPDFYPVTVDGKQSGVETSVVSSTRVKHVLKNSLDLRRYDYYTVGTYDRVRERYVPDNPAGDEHHLRYDYGNFYASKTFYDPAKRRRILWGWANESDTAVDDVAKGWAGIQAIPRKVWLDPSGKQLMQWPVEEVEALRGKNPVGLKDRVVKRGEHVEVTGLQSAQADVEVSFELPSLEGAETLDPALANDAQKLCGVKGADVEGGVGPFGLWVLASSKLEERTAVFFRVFKAARNINTTRPVVLMCSDPSKSSLNPNLYHPTFAGFVDTDIAKGKISLRSLIDRSVVESFGAGGRTCILSRVYPTLAIGKNAHLHVFNNGKADIKVSQLTAWEMKRPALMNGA